MGRLLVSNNNSSNSSCIHLSNNRSHPWPQPSPLPKSSVMGKWAKISWLLLTCKQTRPTIINPKWVIISFRPFRQQCFNRTKEEGEEETWILIKVKTPWCLWEAIKGDSRVIRALTVVGVIPTQGFWSFSESKSWECKTENKNWSKRRKCLKREWRTWKRNCSSRSRLTKTWQKRCVSLNSSLASHRKLSWSQTLLRLTQIRSRTWAV